MAKLPFALQLYSVRGLLQEDLHATLGRVKAAGYDYVETAGLLGHGAEEFSSALSSNGLKAISAHVSFEDCQFDLNRVIAQCKTLGVSWAVISWPSPEEYGGAVDWVAIAGVLAAFGARFRDADITLCYHNNTHEFDRCDGQTVFDLIFKSAASECLAVELDVGWSHYAGADSVALLKAYAGRVPLIHVKDIKTRSEGEAPQSTELGNGSTPFAPIFKAASDTGVQWLIVEQDESARDPMESARMNAAYMRVHVY